MFRDGLPVRPIRRRWWAACSIGTAAVFLTGFILAGMGFAQHTRFVATGGLLQRVTIVGLVWIAVLASHLIRQSPEMR
jgi:hypothetical protein